MKYCSGCQTEKDESEFHKRSARPSGVQSECKACRSSRHLRTCPERARAVQAATAANRTRLAARVAALKERPCMDCGGSFPSYVMDFDHRDPTEKVANIARLIVGGSWKRIQDEIAKCDLVCANCHRIRTHGRRQHDAVPERLMEQPAKLLFAGSSPASVSGVLVRIQSGPRRKSAGPGSRG